MLWQRKHFTCSCEARGKQFSYVREACGNNFIYSREAQSKTNHIREEILLIRAKHKGNNNYSKKAKLRTKFARAARRKSFCVVNLRAANQLQKKH